MNLPDNVADIEQMSPAAIRAATLEMETRAAENPPQLDDSENLEENKYDMTGEDEEEDELENSVGSSEKMEDYSEMEMADDLVIDESRDGSPVDESSAVAVDDDENDRQSKSEEMDNKSEDDKNDMEKYSKTGLSANDIEKIIAQQKLIIQQKAELEIKIQAEIRAQIEAQKKQQQEGRNDSPSPSSVEMSGDLLKPFSGSAERVINPERDNYDVDKIVECWKCNCIFPSRKILVRHLKEHNIDLPYKCYLCDASYDSRSECLIHQADSHRSDWSILKEKNKVDEIDTFSIHMDKVVENNCNKLDSGSVLEIPGQGLDDSKMEVISADYMQRKVYCSLCPKRFWSLQDLRRHMRSHTGTGESLLKSNLCTTKPSNDICTQQRGECGGSVVECRTQEREVGGSKPTAAVLCPWARHFTPRKYWSITQEAVAPSRHDWKIVDWDVKPQHKTKKKKKTSKDSDQPVHQLIWVFPGH